VNATLSKPSSPLQSIWASPQPDGVAPVVTASDVWGAALTVDEAVDLLDWLECHGVHHRALNYVAGEGFAVR